MDYRYLGFWGSGLFWVRVFLGGSCFFLFWFLFFGVFFHFIYHYSFITDSIYTFKVFYFLQPPTHSRLVESVEEFFKLAENIAHFAIERYFGYFHHYVVIGLKDLKQKCIEYYVCFTNMINGGPGEVAKRDISKTEVENAIKSKNLYVIEGPDYPKSDDEKEKAVARFQERKGESAYSLACNNCEHLVSYILTGNPLSEQIRKAGAWTKLFVDGFDNYISHGIRNLLKLSECLLATVPFHFFLKTAVSTVVNEAKRSISWYSSSVTEQVIDRSTKNVCICASNELKVCSTRILKSGRCTNAARGATKSALKKTVAATFLITGVIEGAFAVHEIRKLREQRNKNHIDQMDYKREVTKTVYGAAGASFGSVGAGLIGQAICPIPWFGFALGSAAGNYFGRGLATAVSGLIFDEMN